VPAHNPGGVCEAEKVGDSVLGCEELGRELDGF
jgi:hypothetical protein